MKIGTIFFVLVSSLSSFGQLMYMDQAAGSNGAYISTTTLNNSTYCPYQSANWTINNLSSNAMSYVLTSGVSPTKPQFPAPTTVCGSARTGNDTLLLQYDNSKTPNSAPNESANYQFALESATAVSWGHFWMTTVDVADTHFYSAWVLTTAGGSYAIEHFRNITSPSNTGTIRSISGNSSYIAVQLSKWYWVTVSNSLTLTQVEVYDASTWSPVTCTGTACVGNVLTDIWPGTGQIEWQLGIGRDGADTGNPDGTGYTYDADLIVDPAGSFPVLPNLTNPQNASGFSASGVTIR